MKNRISAIGFKLILASFISAILAGLFMFFPCLVLVAASASHPFAVFFIKHIIAFCVLMFIIYLIFFVCIFSFIIKDSLRYLKEITETLDRISDDNLNIEIPVKSSDELGKLAFSINSMSKRLKILIESERNRERARNEFITNISHDLRTPLTSILGYVELISNSKYSNEEELRHYSEIAYKKCLGLKSLIDNLFEFTKLSNPEIKVRKEIINLGELIKQVLIGFMPEFCKTGMEYRLNFDEVKTFINADPNLIVRLFDNLISNAIKYGKDGKYIDLELCHEGREVIVNLISYGNPIPTKDLPNVFEKFYMVDYRQNNGAGLGLAISKSIVEMFNGKISVHSSGNQTIFEIRFIAESDIENF